MGIRIDCKIEGFNENGYYITYQEDGWTIRDRLSFRGTVVDEELYKLIISKIEDCHLPTVEGIPETVEDIADMDLKFAPWLAVSFDAAMREVMSLPPVSLWQLQQASE